MSKVWSVLEYHDGAFASVIYTSQSEAEASRLRSIYRFYEFIVVDQGPSLLHQWKVVYYEGGVAVGAIIDYITKHEADQLVAKFGSQYRAELIE